MEKNNENIVYDISNHQLFKIIMSCVENFKKSYPTGDLVRQKECYQVVKNVHCGTHKNFISKTKAQ